MALFILNWVQISSPFLVLRTLQSSYYAFGMKASKSLLQGLASCNLSRAGYRALSTASRATSTSSRPFPALKQPRRTAVPQRSLHAAAIHQNSTLTAPGSETSEDQTSTTPRLEQSSYDIIVTCRPCGYRQRHRISKHGYYHGTILVTCPSCKERHVISDHLKIFTDEGGTLEDILKKRGYLVKKGKLGIRHGAMFGNEGEEDIEFWEDGTQTKATQGDSR